MPAERTAWFSENGSGVVTSTSFEPSTDSAPSTRSTIRDHRSSAGSRCTRPPKCRASTTSREAAASSTSRNRAKCCGIWNNRTACPMGAVSTTISSNLLSSSSSNRQQRRDLGHTR